MIKANSKYKKIVNNLNEKEIIKLYVEEKWGSSRIAKHFGCVAYHITSILHKNNIPIYKKNNINTKEVLSLYADNNSITFIANKYKVVPNTIQKILVRNKIKIKDKTGRINVNDCIKLYNNNYTLSNIANKYNVCSGTIKTLLQKNNIQIRTKRKNGKLPKPSINKQASYFFQKLDELFNTKGFYGKNEYLIEELSYYPDYINFGMKLIIEWDEPHHKYIQKLDKKREQEIKAFYPNFEFKRIYQ